MTEPVILNQNFLEPGEHPGDAKDWSISYVATGRGWGNLGKNDSLQPQDNFSWFDKFAEVIGGKDGPFALSNREFDIDTFGYWERRFTVNYVDLRALLPPGSRILIVTTSGADSFGGFHRVDKVVRGTASSNIYVDKDLLWTFPTTAKIVIPPIIYCDVDGYGWAAEDFDLTTYPIKGGGMGAGTKAYITVDRGTRQEIVFAGGEATNGQVLDVFNAQMTEGSAEIIEGQIIWTSGTRGRNSTILVEKGDSKLYVPEVENRGRGQFVQLWEQFFENMAQATAYEIGDAMASYFQHCRIASRFTSSGGWIRATSEHQGVDSKIQIAGPKGSVLARATWPISARVVGVNDELTFMLNETQPVTVTLTEGATEPEVIATDIQTALTFYDTTVEVFESGGQVIIEVYGSIQCTGGSANTDILFNEYVNAYGDQASLDIGFPDGEARGDDGELYESFDDLVSILALFGGEGTAEQFDWGARFASIEEAGVLIGSMLNWLVEVSRGTINLVDQAQNRVSLLGVGTDRSFAYRPGSKAVIEGSPANDNEYTVEYAAYESEVTYVYLAEQLPDGTGGGTLTPQTWVVDGDTFENGWGGAIEEGWISPRVADGRIFGEPITFPLRVQDNRNVLWLCPSLTSMKSMQVTGGEYDTPSALVTELNDQLDASGVSEAFSFEYLDMGDDTYRLTFGKNVERGLPSRHSCAFATVSGRQRGKDIRPTLGFSNLSPNGTERFIIYPRSVFNSINGTPDPGELTEEDSFLVDPYSLVIWLRLSDPTLSMTHVLDNDEEAGLFNDSEPSVGDSYVEEFVIDGWGGPKIEVTLSPDFPDGPPEMSALALFNTDPGPATTYEDFETGWE